jgi:hypothetical protein
VALAATAGIAFAADNTAFGPTIPPAPTIDGYLGLGIGGSRQPTDTTGDNPAGSVFLFSGRGAGHVWLSPGVGLQFSAEGEGTSGYEYAGAPYTEARFSGVLGAHLAMRSSAGSLGVFGAFSGANVLDYCGGNGGALGGVEGQAYLGMTTFYGQAGYGAQFNNAGCLMLDRYWFARAVIRHYLSANLRIYGEIGIADGVGQETGGTPEVDQTIWSWGLGGEARMAGPFSLFVEYTGDRITGGTTPTTVTQQSLLAGVKLNFGEPTLIDSERKGAGFDLPKTYRGMPWGCVVAC